MFFWNSSCFFDDPADVGSLISGSSAFYKTSLNIWKLSSLNSVNRSNLVEKLILGITVWPCCLSRNITTDSKSSKYTVITCSDDSTSTGACSQWEVR